MRNDNKRGKDAAKPNTGQRRNPIGKIIQRAGSVTNKPAHDKSAERTPGRWRRANFYQKLDMVMGTTMTIGGILYAISVWGHHISFLAAASAFLTPFGTAILGTILLSVCVILMSAVLQAWRVSESEASDNMALYAEEDEVPEPSGAVPFVPQGAAEAGA